MAKGHGGSRAGAGRRPDFKFHVRMAIGVAYEAALADIAEKAATKKYQGHKAIKQIAKLRGEMGKVRGRFIERAIGVKKTTPLSDKIDKIGRFRSVPVKRPKGSSLEIMKMIAKDFRTSARMVRSCVNEFRKARTKLRRDLNRG